MTWNRYLRSLLWYEAWDVVWWAVFACFGINMFPGVFLISIPFAFFFPIKGG